MIIFKESGPLRKHLSRLRKKGEIGFVPTMGALHPGHLQLVRRSRAENLSTLCSIFINPTQFNDPQDFKKYPVTTESDIQMLEHEGCDILFMPSVDNIYPDGLAEGKLYQLGELEKILEGKFRPGHFQGVCQVVDVLLSIVSPNRLYLGQKDYQQCMVIAKMLELTEKKPELVICETVREPDGLAMSSRNRRLSPSERSKAVTIFAALVYAKGHLVSGPLGKIKEQALNMLQSEGFRPDYFEFAHARTLEIFDHWNGQDPVVAVAAAFLGEVRLIDNMILNSGRSVN